jgi:hypothetical protein
MTLEERFDQLEAQVAALTARDQRREREHVSLLDSCCELAASRDKLRSSLEEDYTLHAKAVDARITELSARAPDGLTAPEIFGAFRSMAEGAKERDRHIIDIFTMFDDRVRAIEQLLLPALQGRAKIMAVAA